MTGNWFDRFFREKDGNIVIGQPPNPPMLVWAIASVLQLIKTGAIRTRLDIVASMAIVLQLIFKTGAIHTGLDIIVSIELVVWALTELFQGVNYFLRSLGLIVLIATISSRLAW